MPTDPKTGRPVAGPADDATRRAMLKKRLAEKEPLGMYQRPQDPPKESKTATLNPIKNLKQRKSKLDDAIAASGG